MYRIFTIPFAALALLGGISLTPAKATPITVVDTTPRDASNVALTLPLTIPTGTGSGTLTWQQDLKLDGWTAADTITSASLAIVFQDSNGNETLNIFAESTSIGTVVNIPNSGNDPFNVTFSSNINTSLQTDGVLNVAINWTANGNLAFTLASSTLTVNADSPSRDPGPDPVPEPATLALFGASLAGLGLIRRRRRG